MSISEWRFLNVSIDQRLVVFLFIGISVPCMFCGMGIYRPTLSIVSAMMFMQLLYPGKRHGETEDLEYDGIDDIIEDEVEEEEKR